jgi:hypothetical protein
MRNDEEGPKTDAADGGEFVVAEADGGRADLATAHGDRHVRSATGMSATRW